MATPPIPAPEASAEPQSIGTVGRMTGVLFNPKPTFEDIVARPSWLLPLVFLAILSIVVIAIFGQRVGWRGVIERQIEQNPRADQLTQEQKEQAVERGVKFGPPITYVIVVVGAFLGPVIIAAVLLGAFNVMAGTRLDFKIALAIVSFSWMPFAIHGLLSIILLFVKSPDSIEIEHIVASNPAAFLASDSAKWLMSLLTSFDLFTFWVIVLQAIGFSTASPKKVSFVKALTIIVAVWACYVLLKVGWVGAFS
ncbi:MAG: YIP1 family protein [Candidatus Acidiferrales bacterium]